ncbi:MAG: carboxypeptidase-like regulatory domain-containing protein [Bryobacteraceae bacterium]|jgi:hypothetical protein
MKPAILMLLISSALAAQTVEGNVFDALSGAPVVGAIVSISGPARVTARSDSAGHFRLAATQPMIYLQISRAGYINANRNVKTNPDKPASDLRIDLTPTAVISGKLVDDEGSPVEGAQVTALRYQLVNGERKLQPGSGTWTAADDLGTYRIANLPAGRYYVRATAGALGNWDGRYMGEYYPGGLQPTADGLVEVKAGEERRGIDLRFTKHEGVTVEGRIAMADGSAAPKHWPHVHMSTDEFGGPSFFAFRSSPDGTFRFAHVPPGVYTLRANSENYPPRAGDLFAEQRLQVGDSSVRDLTLTMRAIKPVDISGTIVFAEGAAPRQMLINVRAPQGNDTTSRSSDDGTFTLQGLLPGHHDLQIMPSFQTMPDSLEAVTAVVGHSHAVSARLGDQEVLDRGFDLDGSSVPALTITVSSRFCELKGELLDAAGKPVAEAIVELESGQPGGSAVAVTDADGRFHLIASKAGQYRIYAIDPAHADSLSDPDYLDAHAKDFPPVVVADGENPPLTLRQPI